MPPPTPKNNQFRVQHLGPFTGGWCWPPIEGNELELFENAELQRNGNIVSRLGVFFLNANAFSPAAQITGMGVFFSAQSSYVANQQLTDPTGVGGVVPA